MSICLRCGKILEPLGGKDKTNPSRKFCDVTCRTKYNSKLYYEKNKNKQEYLKKKREYLRKWVNENRKHFNELVREKNRVFQKKQVEERKLKGLCLRCGKKRENKKFKTCSACRKKKRLQQKAYILKCINNYKVK